MSALFEAYLAGDARAFYANHFADADDRRQAVVRASRPLASDVAAALEAQNARFTPSPAREANLVALQRGAAAVVTGQQVGLFLGPLFTLYKVASAIRTARALGAESGQPVVPVFWLQTEDHDLPEIATTWVPSGRGSPVALQLPSSADDRVSLEHCVLPQAVDACLDKLRAEIGNLPHATEHLARLARHYRPGAGWVAAFAGMLADLFADDGLVMVDPRDPALAAVTASLHHHALTQAASIAAALEERTRALAAAGFVAPVHVRSRAPLSFFHPDGASGPRYRLEPAAGGYREVGGDGVYALATLLDALAAEPLRFSTSVLLRPILQDTLLPTAAYVGGPAEVAYFAQLGPLYASYGLTMPLVVPRARFRLLEDKTVRLLAKLHLDADDAQRSEDVLLGMTRAGDGTRLEGAELVRQLGAPFAAAMDRIKGTVEAAGPGLNTAIDKTRATVEMAIAKLADKYEKACLHQDQGLVDCVRRLQAALYPHRLPQERVYGMAYFAARYGERAFVERVMAHVQPFDATPRDLSLADDAAATGVAG